MTAIDYENFRVLEAIQLFAQSVSRPLQKVDL